MSRILLIGSNGQVGQELQRALAPLGDVVSVGRDQVDLADPDSSREMIRKIQPNVVVNAAAYTAVDKAELESRLAQAVNATSPTAMAEEAERIGAWLIHISTDYVFNGQKSTPYSEQDTPNPIGVYGQSKLAGEEGIQRTCKHYLILRTAWVYGVYGKGNFVKTMLRLGADRDEIRVVADQVGTPTWANDIAGAIAHIIPHLISDESSRSVAPGIYHFTNSGVASWYDFAVAIFEEAKQLGFPLAIKRVVPITTSEYPTPAQRPAYSVLAHQKISAVLGDCPPHWRHALKHMLTDLYSYTYESSYSIGR